MYGRAREAPGRASERARQASTVTFVRKLTNEVQCVSRGIAHPTATALRPGRKRGGKPRYQGIPSPHPTTSSFRGSAALDLGETVEHDVAKAPRLTESASAVFAVLAGAGTATRPQLASLAGLSKPTVSSAVAELENARLAAHSGIASGGSK